MGADAFDVVDINPLSWCTIDVQFRCADPGSGTCTTKKAKTARGGQSKIKHLRYAKSLLKGF